MQRHALALIVLAATVPAYPQAATPAKSEEKPAAISLRELSLSLERLSGRVRESVVQIYSTGYTPASDDSEGTSASSLFSRQTSTGSGVILTGDGYIVTNSHVVRGAQRIEVRLPSTRENMPGHHSILKPSGRVIPAKVVGMDRETDLAVIKIDRTGLRHLELGNSEDIRQGDLVMAFGNPLGLEGSVSMGIVSSTARQIKADDPMIYIQTDAPINPGNSGGPLVDSDGSVVGINTFILTQSGGSEGLGFAIPSNIVSNVFNQIRKEGHVHRAELGLFAQTVMPAIAHGLGLAQDWGAIVSDIDEDGPADRAGVKVGDIIASLDGKPIENARQLRVNVYSYRPGQKAKLALLRGKEKLTAEVEVKGDEADPERFADMVTPDANLVQRLGILCIAIDNKLAALLPDLRNKFGLVVAGGGARDLTTGTSLQVGDVIYTVNQEPVATVAALRKKLDEFKTGDAPVFQIERSGRLMYVAIELE